MKNYNQFTSGEKKEALQFAAAMGLNTVTEEAPADCGNYAVQFAEAMGLNRTEPIKEKRHSLFNHRRSLNKLLPGVD